MLKEVMPELLLLLRQARGGHSVMSALVIVMPDRLTHCLFLSLSLYHCLCVSPFSLCNLYFLGLCMLTLSLSPNVFLSVHLYMPIAMTLMYICLFPNRLVSMFVCASAFFSVSLFFFCVCLSPSFFFSLSVSL